ncbi:hypothetical protein EF847_10310 [Actinobacteria bacterium YIM 96077]|uniref:Uncharacterized protein n=2 Tax=Phytoactinopolyspora halophila TaxID=1981511 RepID=A0A329QBH7_9ACTN|nr:hypothetical protein EF847_10310 [Actinobacteria bacterium YIM 96077]RAW09706.1 hypothetical protein DPM12_20315 [Phytoactinopolyspora halophila]
MRTIVYDDVMLISKDDLVDAVWGVGDEILKDLGQHLAAILTPTAGATPGRRPRAYPQTREIRFADLHIEGEADKPVVVVSSEEYGERVGYVFVIACRVSSDSTKIRTFDVKLRSQNGKVVCSHIQSVHRRDITYRTTTGAKFVTAGEAWEIVGEGSSSAWPRLIGRWLPPRLAGYYEGIEGEEDRHGRYHKEEDRTHASDRPDREEG